MQFHCASGRQSFHDEELVSIMIVKQRDARPEVISELQARGGLSQDRIKRVACYSAVSRLQADTTTQEATDAIDIQFGQSDEWAVIHDLRLCVGGHAVQINHVLIHNSLGVVCLDSRFLEYGLEISENGQTRLVNRLETRLVSSPLRKMAKDIRMMRQHFDDADLLDGKRRLKKRLAVKGYILTNPGLRLSLLCPSLPEHVGVHASSALFALLWKRDLTGSKRVKARVSADELFDLAVSLTEAHLPVYPQSLFESDSLVDHTTRQLFAAAA